MDLRAFHARLARLELVDPERDLIEKLDLVDLVAGNLRYAATSGPDLASVERLRDALEERTTGLRHATRLSPDDRPERLEERGAPAFVVAAIAARPAPLALVFSWRAGERAPPRAPARLRIGPLLGYPGCCVRFEEARRSDLVLAEAAGMVETWRVRSTKGLLRGIDARWPYLMDDDAAGEAGRIARLRRFPFVSFVPCAACCESDASPAGRENARRRALAGTLDPGLVRAIERVRGARRR